MNPAKYDYVNRIRFQEKLQRGFALTPVYVQGRVVVDIEVM